MTKVFALTRLGLCIFYLLLITAAGDLHAQTFTVLHNFAGSDGAYPASTLVRDSAGNLYGTTQEGGTSNFGVVFLLKPNGQELFFSFNGSNGKEPFAGLLRDPNGNLYGTTEAGGAVNGGTVFKITKSGKESILYSFQGNLHNDGNFPLGALIGDPKGNLYGTTSKGGGQYGTVFTVNLGGVEKVLHAFSQTDGAYPIGKLLRDAGDNLYGTTSTGGANSPEGGVVFRLDAAGNEVTLYNFCSLANCADGALPQAGLIADGSGNLYGTTYIGGTHGGGTIFKLNAKTGIETVLYSFCSLPVCTDGQSPYSDLLMDTAGNLYGTTVKGGNTNLGVVFKLDTSGNETVLHSFSGTGDGANPYAGLIADHQGNLYGTASMGGANSKGTVFQITP